MTASEFAFLALGLVLGVASGAALSIVVRTRPLAPREVRVTVAPDAVPRRPAATLSGIGRPLPMDAPARGGPADPDVLGSVGVSAIGTSVRTAAGPRPPLGVPIRPEPNRLHGRAAHATDPATAASAVAVLEPRDAAVAPVGPSDVPLAAAGIDPARSSGGTIGAGDVAAADPCAGERRIAEERCALADRLHEEAAGASTRLRAAQREYDDRVTRADRAAAATDPRAIRAAKEEAWAHFRRANVAARSSDAGEAAARDWLQEIDRINRSARDAVGEAQRGRDGANAMVMTIERLTLEADAARINAESAAEACVLAREALAACEEAGARRNANGTPGAAGGEPEEAGRARLVAGPELEPGDLAPAEAAQARVFGDREPAVTRLLRGDRDTMHRLVAALAGPEPEEQRRWQVRLGALVEAIVGRAIEASALDFPRDHPFWEPFSQAQCRDIATALASLGYRFDGLGGFVDRRFPSQRDLSLAVGYAGLDPMRTRHWPNEREMPDLYREVTVAATEFLAGAAGTLSLGEMVEMLRGRAEELTDLWNAWGRIRPLLLQP